jgi:transcriptional regulator with XRE-family HTH domain
MRLIRLTEGIKANRLAKELGISPSYLSLIENGKKRPSVEMIEQFARVIGVRPSQIMFFNEELDDSSKNTSKNDIVERMRPLMMKWLRGMASKE